MAEPRIATVEILRDYLDARDAEGKDRLLERFLLGAEGLAERYARRRFSPDPPLTTSGADTNTPVTRTFTTFGKTSVRVPDLRSVTSISHLGVTLDTDDYFMGFSAGAANPATHLDLAFSSGMSPALSFGQVARVGGYEVNDLTITGRWGFNPTPDDVVHAVCLIAAKQWKRRDAGYADVAFDETNGQVRVAQAIPSDAKTILDTYRVLALAVI